MAIEPETTLSDGFDYWILRICRDSAAVVLFIIGPILQVAVTRWMPAAILLALVFLLVGHAITGFRHLNFRQSVRSFRTDPVRLLVLSFAAFVVWYAIGIFRSPIPLEALFDVAALLALIPIALILARECSRTIIAPMSIMVMSGSLIGATLVLLDLLGLTSLYALRDTNSELYDLNRNTIGLVFLAIPIAVFSKPTALHKILAFGFLIVLAAVLWATQSQTAQLAAVFAGAVWGILTVAPRLRTWLIASAAAFTLVFPLLLPLVGAAVTNSSSSFLKDGHALHRAAIWQGYADEIADSPIFGTGAKADRHLAMKGALAETLSDAGFDTRTTHPHNFVLEIWVNFGLIGAILFAAVLLSLAKTVAGLGQQEGMAATCLLVAAYVSALVGASWLQGWYLAALVIAIVAFLGWPRREDKDLSTDSNDF
ncbi:O-antigen ligase family protein [Pseudahrensia aquimaris]|uniref:O-antigen ligase family protein n=1 Tax=Pseudahrensia aquimaris TaxID=744461 RepID=A0ABW3FH94_9HYPH